MDLKRAKSRNLFVLLPYLLCHPESILVPRPHVDILHIFGHAILVTRYLLATKLLVARGDDVDVVLVVLRAVRHMLFLAEARNFTSWLS